MDYINMFKKTPKISEQTKKYFTDGIDTTNVSVTASSLVSSPEETSDSLFKFNRKKFFDAYRNVFGPLDSELVKSLDILLNQIEKDNRFVVEKDVRTPRRQLSYCLATFKWETAHTMKPIKEYGGNEYFNKRYGPQTKVGKMLGNTKPGDGAKFCGRGFVQLTGRNNYERAGKYLGIDLTSNPEKACNPDIAYRIAIEGMIEGWFTGKKLSNYFADGKIPQWDNARRIINGTDRAAKIASIARQFDEILVVSLV